MIRGTTPTGRNYADIVLYTHNRQVFQRITRKIGRGYPRDNYACNTLAIVSARMLCVPRVGMMRLMVAAVRGCDGATSPAPVVEHSA
jgi:hypothetical protein